MVLRRVASITRASGRGLGPGSQDFFGPVKWHKADRRVPCNVLALFERQRFLSVRRVIINGIGLKCLHSHRGITGTADGLDFDQ